MTQTRFPASRTALTRTHTLHAILLRLRTGLHATSLRLASGLSCDRPHVLYPTRYCDSIPRYGHTRLLPHRRHRTCRLPLAETPLTLFPHCLELHRSSHAPSRVKVDLLHRLPILVSTHIHSHFLRLPRSASTPHQSKSQDLPFLFLLPTAFFQLPSVTHSRSAYPHITGLLSHDRFSYALTSIL